MRISILHTTHTMGYVGGTAHDLSNLGRYLDAGRFRTLVATTNPPDGPERPLYRGELLPYRCARGKPWFLQWGFIRNLRRTIRRERVRIVHTHGDFNMALGCLAALGTSARVIRTLHGLDSLCRRPPGLIARTWPRLVEKYVILNPAKMHEAREVYAAPPGKILVIPAGVDLHEIRQAAELRDTTRKELGIPKTTCVLAVIARLTAVKGYTFLLQAMRLVVQRTPDVVLLVAGEGEERTRIEQQIKELKLGERVRLLGLRTDVAALHAAADIYVQPSLKEALGLSLVEAMAAGTPVVTSDLPTLRSVVTEGAGLRVPPRDTAALADAVICLIEDPKLRETMGKAATRQAEKFGVERMVNGYEELYESLCGIPVGVNR